MASEKEIGHASHRQSLSAELDALIEGEISERGWELIKRHKSLVSIEGALYTDTIREQSLRSRWEFEGGHWIQTDIFSTGEDWDALVVITSSGADREARVPQGGDAAEAISALRRVMADLDRA